jgi:hypothetical protein
MNAILAKIFGWGQFIAVAGTQIFGSQQIHGWQGWLASIVSFAVAIAAHTASNTDGVK